MMSLKPFGSQKDANLASLHSTPSVFKLNRFVCPIVSPLFLFLEGIKLRINSDIILCQYHPHHFVFPMAVLLGKYLDVPVIARADDIHRQMSKNTNSLEAITKIFIKLSNTINEAFVKYVSIFFVVCSEQRSMLESRIGRRNNILVNHNGVEIDDLFRLDNEANNEALRKYFGINKNEKIILFIGRFSGNEYVIENLIDAFLILNLRISDTTLFLVSDTLTERLQEKTANQKIKIIGAASRSDIKKYLTISDVCVGPIGRTQTIPLKIQNIWLMVSRSSRGKEASASI